MSCIYCLGKNSNKLSREHVISRTVLETVFGKENRNITKIDFIGNKTLLDHEHIIKDVCDYCNSKLLSHYDKAGALLVKEIDSFYDATGKILHIDFDSIGWLIKTHLNFIRLIPEKDTKKYYLIKPKIYKSLVERNNKMFKLLDLYIEGWQGEQYFWDKDDSKKIPYFSYKSVCFPYQNILVSDFRLKGLNTFVLIPSNANYDNFEFRKEVTLKAMKERGFNLQKVNMPKVINKGIVKIENIVNTETLKKGIIKI